MLNINKFYEGPEPNGDCVDLVRIREDGKTLFESCGTQIGVKIISNSNKVTLDLISSSKVFAARGFLLQYEGNILINHYHTEIN